MPELMHLVSLQQGAGVEAHFTEFVVRAAARHAGFSHGLVNPERTVHEFFRAPLAAALSRTVLAKYRWGVKLPSWPPSIRRWHCGRELKGASVALIWNRTLRNRFVVDAMGAANCIHWEHGSVWHPGRESVRRRYLASVPLAITNSRASARVLELMWDFKGRIEVCRNALRPSMLPSAPIQKRYPDGPWRLGVAARLMPVKGIPQILLAVKALRDRGQAVELEVAGAGPERDALVGLTERLGLAAQCRFLGSVEDMAGFYRRIDCLVHMPLTEAFGLVAIEAAAHGCPVIAAAVDGLPEALAHGITGLSIAPTLPLASYAGAGAGLYGIPEQIYDPRQDALAAPAVVDPAALAQAVEQMFADPERYESMSRAAGEHVRAHYDFDTHVDEVMRVIADFAAAR